MLVDAGFEKGGNVVILGGSCISGFFAAFCSLPFDFIKTGMQKMTPNPDGTMPYKGPLDFAGQTMRNHGPLKFYTGFPTYLFRIAPHVVFTLIFLDTIQYFQKKAGF